MSDAIRVLFIDDDPIIPQIMESVFRVAGMRCMFATSQDDISEIIRDAHPDIVIMEVVLRFQDGMKLVGTLRRLYQYTQPVIAISDHQNPELIAHIRECVFFNGYLPKPLDPVDLPGYLHYKIEHGKAPWADTTHFRGGTIS